MAKLYCVPLGHSPRSLFFDQLQSVGYDKGVLVLPSRVLMKKAEREANVRIIDIDYLATTILYDNGYINLRQINRRSQELVIKDLVKHLANGNKLGYFGVLAEKKGFIKALTSLVGQLSRNGYHEDEILNALRDWNRTGNQGQKDWDITQLYGLYRRYLRDNNWFDLEGKYRLAMKVLQEENVKVRWEEICISDFFTFDALQFGFIKALAKRVKVSVGMMYEANKDNIFRAVQKTYDDLLGFCELEKVNYPAKSAPENVRVCEFKDRNFEMEWVLIEVKRLLKNGVPAKDILITFRKLDNYNGLRNLADAYGVPVSIPQSSNLNVQALSELVLLLLEAQSDTRKGAEAYFKILGCGLSRIIFKVDGVVSNAWRKDTYYTSRSQVQEKCKEEFTDANSLELLDDCLAKLPASSTVVEYAAILEEFLKSINLEAELGNLHKNGSIDFVELKACLLSKQLILKCLQSLAEDYKNCGVESEKLSLQDFTFALREAMNDYQVTIADGRTDGVLITEVINAQGLAHKYVFLMGMREGEFPTGNNENWIYNDQERGELQGFGIDMPTTALSYVEDAYFFATITNQAEKSLVLTYYADDQAGASAYVGDALKMYGIKETEVIIEKQPASLGEAFALGKNLDTDWMKVNLEEHVAIATSVDEVRKTATIYNGVLENEEVRANVSKLVGNMFSSSSLEVYAQCPFRFLGERVWKQSEAGEKEEQATPQEEGNVLHKTLERFLGKHLNEKLPKYSFDQLWEELKQDFQDVTNDFVANGKVPQNEMWTADQNRLLNTLKRWLRYEYDMQNKWDFVPYALEWDFSSKNGRPLRMTLDDGRSFSIGGRIDRIDKNGDKLFVTDYKLSSTPGTNDLKNAIDLQMPIYLLSAGKQKDKEIVGGGYLSLKYTKRSPNLKLDDGQKIPFATKSADVFVGAEDKWKAFKDFSEMVLRDYVQGIYDGNFNIELRKKCSDYCPFKDICRKGNNKQGGEGDE